MYKDPGSVLATHMYTCTYMSKEREDVLILFLPIATMLKKLLSFSAVQFMYLRYR